MSEPIIDTVDDLVDKLGGTKLAAEKLNTTPQNVSNWKAAKKLPTDKYLRQKAALKTLGFAVADELWFAEQVA